MAGPHGWAVAKATGGWFRSRPSTTTTCSSGGNYSWFPGLRGVARLSDGTTIDGGAGSIDGWPTSLPTSAAISLEAARAAYLCVKDVPISARGNDCSS
jgi:hypothetical protein